MEQNHNNYRGTSNSRSRSSSAGRSTSGGSARSSTSRSSTSGQTRPRASGSARSSSTRRSGTTSYRGTYGTHSSHSGHGTSYGGRRRKGRGGPEFFKIAAAGVVLIIAISIIVFLVKGIGAKTPEETELPTEETTTEPETELQKEVMVDGINITGMSREDAKNAILKNYPWGMKVTWEDDTYEVKDLMGEKVDALLVEIFQGEPKENYTLDTSGLGEAVRAEAASAAALWDRKAKNGSISGYDASSDSFTFSGAEQGRALDQDKLAADIQAALDKKDFDAVIAAVVNPVEPEFSEATAKEKYKTLASFTTKTTSNSKRNTNVKLAAQAINGKILQPGEEFSFNETVGQRTAEKGYQGAAAYNNGEVVEEIGGGVCQVSSTLYNVVLQAGLKTTVRRSHTYEPSYVTPGTDATVSWGGPDYKFVNNSSTAIGIRASYSNQTVTISLYGIPVLEEGVKYSLKSTKIKDIDPPAPTYEEDGTVEPGAEKVKSSGSKGSYWETRLVVTKDGEVVSQDVDHTVTYKGHAPVVLRNTSGTLAPTDPSDALAGESTIDPNGVASIAPEGAGDGIPGGIAGTTAAPAGPAGPAGPGVDRPSETSGPGSSLSAPGDSGQQNRPSSAPVPDTSAQAPAEQPGTPTPAPGGNSPAGPASVPPQETAPAEQIIAPMPGV